MITNWYQSESMEALQEWDTTSSPTTVYQRRNIRRVTRGGVDGDVQEVYTYEERTMSQADYAAQAAELESPAMKLLMQQMSAIELRQEILEGFLTEE